MIGVESLSIRLERSRSVFERRLVTSIGALGEKGISGVVHGE